VTQKKVTTPEDKPTEDKAVRLQTELYLSESNVPKFRISKDRRAEIKKELNISENEIRSILKKIKNELIESA